MKGHHLILGRLTDFVTGKVLKDTHDERYRQKIARLLIEKKGYRKSDVSPRCELLIAAGDKRAIVIIDFNVALAGRAGMMIKYGPGSLVTRHRPALAAARLLEPYQIPVVVVTNGEDADVLNGATGKVVSHGLSSIPSRTELEHMTKTASFNTIAPERAEMESRILFAFEVDGCCPCDDSVCRL